jgi:Leucine-rich repeat (LRR) protein
MALPDDIGSLKNLKRLNLAVNQLNKLPDSFGKLENIEILELWLNKFELIPKIISTLPKLHDLYDSFDTEKLNKTLIRAVFANNKVLAEKLIFYGADVNYKLQGFGSHLFTTPLFEAKTLILVKFLLSKGANPYLKRELVKTVLTKDGEEIRSTGRFETFLSKNHTREIAEYLQTATLPPEPPDEPDHSSDDVFF